MYLEGVGDVEPALYRIAQAVEQYDERLFLGRLPEDGKLYVFVKMPRDMGIPPMTVFGLAAVQHEGEFPTPEQVIKKLHEADTTRHAGRLIDRINAANAKVKKDRDAQGLDKRRDVYERLEFYLRQLGYSPVIKSTRPRVRG
jgi:hypothetical protein